jgi:hypothetical protein
MPRTPSDPDPRLDGAYPPDQPLPNLSLSDILENLLLQEYDDAWEQEEEEGRVDVRGYGEPFGSGGENDAWMVSGSCTIFLRSESEDDTDY